MDSNFSIKEALKQLFNPDVNQKIVRKISKELSSVKSSDIDEALTAECAIRLKGIIKQDPIQAIHLVFVLSEGALGIQNGIIECMEDVLKIIFENLKCIKNITVSSKNSQYQEIFKALFNVLQYLMPKVTLEENSVVYYNLKQIFYLLYELIETEKVPWDSFMIVGTSLSLLITYLNNRNRGKTFITLIYALCNKINIQSLVNVKYEATLETDFDYIHINKEIITESYLENVESSYRIFLLVNGLINSNLSWLYDDINFEFERFDSRTNVQKKENTLQEENVQCAKKIEEKNEVLNNADYNPLLYKLFPIIYKCCNSHSNYKCNAFQTLYMWIKCVRKLGKQILSEDKYLENVKSADVEIILEKKKQFFNENYILSKYSQHPADLSLFAVTSESSISVFAFLNANWESPVKGVSEVVRDCIMELIEMYGDAHKGHTEKLAMQMLSALVEGAAWGSKSTYPPLELAVHYVGATKALELYPELSGALAGCLSINYLGPPASSVYKLMLTHLTMELWCKHFMQHFLNSVLNPDRGTRQQALSLWLPPTLKTYPQLTKQLLSNFNESNEGWLAKMSVLKTARSIGILHLENNILLKKKNQSSNFKKNVDKVTDMKTDPPEMGDDCLNDMIQKIKFGLCHIDEMVRAEAFDLICRTQKTSEPFSYCETNLIKHFFTYNMNIDSSYFRQNIIKTFRVLMVRVRDSCSIQLKKSPFRYFGSENFKPELLVKYEINESLRTNCELLLWLLRNLHINFAPDGNYQRRVLCLQLYKELLLTFYEPENCSFTYKLISRCKMLNAFIKEHGEKIEKESLLSEEDTNSLDVYSFRKSSFYLYSQKCEVNFNGFILPWTREMLYNACLDDMSDVREEAELILQIIQSENKHIRLEDTLKWFKYGLSLCDSPKSSEAESGAALVKMIDLAIVNSDIKPTHIFKDLGLTIEDGNIFGFLLSRLEKQFEIAQKNLLRAAVDSPIHGTVMALNRCLSQTVLNTGITADKLRRYFTRLSAILISLVEFVLKNLAMASSGGSAIAPSFAEMGESIELILKECMKKDPSLLDKTRESEDNYRTGETLSVNEVADSGSISGNHHLVLSCCWQTIKMCCLISSKCIQHYSSSLSEDTTESLLRHVMVRVLTGTRLKGAMEHAKAAYAQACSFLLSSKSNVCTGFIQRQVYEVLDQLEAGAETSITRRGAGLAMMVDAACGAAPRCSAHLIDTTLKRLINISNMDNVDDGKMDASPALSLHILHSLVLNSSLAQNVQGHLPNITITCITAFSSSSWGKRNAALQLYGSVVPRMVGQKKVKDDSSIFNSLTAPEFLSRYPVLADFLLHVLSKVCYGENEKKNDRATNLDANLLGNKHFIECCSNKELDSIFLGGNAVTQASYLVPVLSLLSRLSPGTGLQQTPELSKTLQNYSSVTLALMKSPVHTVRRLASLALISLTPTREIPLLLDKILYTISNNNHFKSANLIHGHLLILQNVKHFYPEIYKHNSNKSKILDSMQSLMLTHKDCLVINTIAIKLYKDLEPQQMIETEIIQNSKPGDADYIREVTALNLNHSETKSTLEQYFFSNCQDEMETCIRFIEEKILIYKENENLSELYENIIWKRLEIESLNKYKQVSSVLKLFIVFLNNCSSLKHLPSEKSICTLHSLLSGTMGLFVSSQALKITSHIIKVFPEKILGKDFFLKEYVSLLNHFANPVSTEDYRLAAAESLIVSLSTLLNNNLIFSQKEILIVACINLLQDEDSEIRDTACKIVYSLSFCRSPNVNQLQNANMSLKVFIYGISIHYIHLGDIEMFQILWKLCHGPLLQNLQSPLEILGNDVSCYLFTSHTMNLYMEPKHISLTIAQAVMCAISQHNKMTNNPQFQKWFDDQLLLINKEGEAVKYYLKMEKMHLSKRQKLLIYLNRYIIASQLLVRLAKTLKITLILQHPIQFDNHHYCFLLDQENFEP